MAKAGTLCPHQSLKHGVSMGVLVRYQSSTAREWDVCATCDHCCQLKVSRSSCGGTAAIIKALLCSAHCITTAFLNLAAPTHALQGLSVRAKSHLQVSCLSRTSLQGQQTSRECSKTWRGSMFSAKEPSARFSLHAEGHLTLSKRASGVSSI